MLVSRFMTRRPVTVRADAPLEEAVRLMEEHGHRHLPVVGSDELVGLLTDRDVHLGTGGRPPAELGLTGSRFVRDAMRTPVMCVEEDERSTVAATRMIEQRLGALPVLADGRLDGIVTETNLVQAFRDLCRDPANADVLDATVEEAMRSELVTFEPGTTVAEAAARCVDWRLRHVPVVRDDEVVGLVSERDLRVSLGRALVAAADARRQGREPPPALTVADLMQDEVVLVDPREMLSDVAPVMLSARLAAVPVGVDGVLMGVLTRADVVEHYASVA